MIFTHEKTGLSVTSAYTSEGTSNLSLNSKGRVAPLDLRELATWLLNVAERLHNDALEAQAADEDRARATRKRMIAAWEPL